MPADVPFEMRAGVRVFITAPRDDLPSVPFGDEGYLWEQNFKATVVSQHSKDRWYVETDNGSRVLVSKADVVPLNDDGPLTFGEQIFLWLVVLGVLVAIWVGLGTL